MSFSSLKFPYKLFRIVSECKSGCIRWSSDGNSVLISFPSFQKQYLSDNAFFKTHQMSSFVRSLNIYGFEKQRTEKKVYMPGQNEYRHKHFLRDYPSCLDLVTRKTGRTKSAIAKPKPVLKSKENKPRGRKSTRKRSKVADLDKNCENSSETEDIQETLPESEDDDSFEVMNKIWMSWMKDVDVRKEDLDFLVREEERWINLDEVEYDHVSWDDTGSIGVPPRVSLAPRNSVPASELEHITIDE